MYNQDLIPLIRQYQKRDMSSFESIYQAFIGLIRHYDLRLKRDHHFEDGEQELTVFLVEILFQIQTERFVSDISNSMQRYIAVALSKKYIHLSRQLQIRKSQEVMLEDQDFPYLDQEFGNLFVVQITAVLGEKQRQVIYLHDLEGYSIAEIAAFLNISRQAVNQTRLRGLKILRQYLSESPPDS